MPEWIVGALAGLPLWLWLLAPAHVRRWDAARRELGLPPADPPGILGWRARGLERRGKR